MSQFDYFDPDELKRRKVLTPAEQTPEEYFSSVVNSPDEGDQEEEAEGPIKPPNASTLHPALEQFKKVISSQPQREDYKPSKARKIGGVLAGIATLSPQRGIATAQNVMDQPYQRAMTNWNQSVQSAQLGMTAEEKTSAQDIATQRAQAYGVSSQARMKAADATEAWRKSQEANAPWHPKTEEEAERFEKSKQRPTGYQPQTQEEYLKVHPPRNYGEEESAREAAAMARAKLHEGAATSRSAAHDAAMASRPGHVASPKEQEEAEIQAANELLRSKPEYGAFVHAAEVNNKTGKVVRASRIKTADELPKAGGGFLGMGGTSEAQASLARDQYRQFLMDLDKHKKAVLGRSSGQQTWSIEPEEEEEQ